MTIEVIQPLLQGLTLAVLLWVGRSIIRVSETVAVHDWRIKALEDK